METQADNRRAGGVGQLARNRNTWMRCRPYQCERSCPNQSRLANWGLITLAQLGGIFFAISMFSKILLSRTPCWCTQEAIACTPFSREVFSFLPKTCSALPWSEKAIFTSLRGFKCTFLQGFPIAEDTISANLFTVCGTSAPTLKI